MRARRVLGRDEEEEEVRRFAVEGAEIDPRRTPAEGGDHPLEPRKLSVRDGDALADIAYRVRFSSSEGGQTATLRRIEGAQAAGTSDGGQAIVEGAPVSMGRMARVTEAFRRSCDKHDPRDFGMFSCSKTTNELNYTAQKFVRSVMGTNNIDSCNRT